jgi:ABC-type transport system involved in multi-copper enzyme maturation permease subunit
MQTICAALFGPVFAKELLELARRRRYYFIRALFGLGFLFVLFFAFQTYEARLRLSGDSNVRVMAAFAETTFCLVGIVQFIALFVFVPMFLCGAVAGEREEQTLELLFTTTLEDREIVLGKMLSRLVVFALLILMGLPIFGLISLMGGIDPPSVYRFAGAMLVALLYAGAHSIYYSTITKSPMGALVRTYWHLALRLLGIPIIASVSAGIITAFGPAWFAFMWLIGAFVCLTNPLAPLTFAVVPDLNEFVAAQAGRFGSGLGSWYFPLLLVFPTARSVYLIYQAVRRLRMVPRPAQSFLYILYPIRHVLVSIGSLILYPFRRFRSAPERLLWLLPIHNLLWLRARQTHCFDREGYLRRLQTWSWVAAGIALLLYYLNEPRVFSKPGILILFLPLVWSVVAIFTTIVASISVVGDRRRGFVDLLLATPLSNREIVNGVVLSTWTHVTRIALLPLALTALFRLTGAGNSSNLVQSLAIAYLFLVAVTCQGIACSLCARSYAGALAPACVFVIITTVGTALLIPTFQRHAPAALWISCAAGLFISSYWVRRQLTSASVGCYFLFVYESFVTTATCWIGWQEPVTAINVHEEALLRIAESVPSFLAFTLFAGYRTPLDFVPHAEWIRPCHLLATLLFCLWARWWLTAHFDALAGRTFARQRRPGSLAAGVNAIVRFFYWHVPEALRPRWPGRAKVLLVEAEAPSGAEAG